MLVRRLGFVPLFQIKYNSVGYLLLVVAVAVATLCFLPVTPPSHRFISTPAIFFLFENSLFLAFFVW
jgi:hypothetical protein